MAMTLRAEAIEYTLGFEGGFSNHRHDPGSKTIYGVASASWPEWYRYIMAAYREDDIVEAQKRALQFYREEIGSKRPFGDIEDINLQALVFDMHVNHSFRGAGLTIQKALNYLSSGLNMNPLTEDGWMGAKTVARANELHRRYPEAVLAAICSERYKYYQSLIDRNSNLQSFARGWARRCFPPQL